MKLKRKLLLYMVTPAFLLCIVGFVGLYSLHRLEKAADNILSDNYHSIQEARLLERTLRKLEENPESAANTSRRKEKSEELALIFNRALTRCERNITESGEQGLLREIRRLWQVIRLRLVNGSNSDIVAREPSARILLIAPLFKKLDEFLALNERAMFAYERKERKLAQLMFGVTGISMGIALLTLVLFAMITASRISRPITKVADDLFRTLKPEAARSHSGKDQGNEMERLETELKGLLARLSKYDDDQSNKLMRLQERSAFVMEKVNEGLILFDEELNFMSVNYLGRRLLGLEENAYLNVNLKELRLSENLGATLMPIIEEKNRSERDLAEFQFDLDGDRRIYKPRLLPISSDTGSAEGYLLVIWDVTEERQFEEDRRRFIAMLSHQLKTPITAISMSINLIWEKFRGRTTESDELLAVAKSDCTTLSVMVNELIDATRDVQPGLVLRPQRIELVKLLRDSLRPIRARAKERGIVLKDRLGDTPVFAEVDPVKFPWVVTNILNNALRYTGKDGSIMLNLRIAERHVELEIADTGVGIAPEDQKRLFLPFTSLGQENEPGSIGLGLAIVKELIEAHNGTIELESRLNRGSTFKIRIPLGRGVMI